MESRYVEHVIVAGLRCDAKTKLSSLAAENLTRAQSIEYLCVYTDGV